MLDDVLWSALTVASDVVLGNEDAPLRPIDRYLRSAAMASATLSAIFFLLGEFIPHRGVATAFLIAGGVCASVFLVLVPVALTIRLFKPRNDSP